MIGWEGKYWYISPKRNDHLAYIFCHMLDKPTLSFGDKRRIWYELKRLEDFLKENGKEGWIACTKPQHQHIITFLKKLDAVYYSYVEQENNIYYAKYFKE